MKTTIVYESTTGNTERMANTITSVAKEAGATLLNNQGVIANLSPDEEALTACANLGKMGTNQ